MKLARVESHLVGVGGNFYIIMSLLMLDVYMGAESLSSFSSTHGQLSVGKLWG